MISRFTSGLDGTRDVDGTDTASRWHHVAGCRSDCPDGGYVQGAMERAEAGHAKADQVRMARDVATMSDELKAMADHMPSCTATERGSGRNWSGGVGGIDG